LAPSFFIGVIGGLFRQDIKRIKKGKDARLSTGLGSLTFGLTKAEKAVIEQIDLLKADKRRIAELQTEAARPDLFFRAAANEEKPPPRPAAVENEHEKRARLSTSEHIRRTATGIKPEAVNWICDMAIRTAEAEAHAEGIYMEMNDRITQHSRERKLIEAARVKLRILGYDLNSLSETEAPEAMPDPGDGEAVESEQ